MKCSSFERKECAYAKVKEVVDHVMCVPGSCASDERIFSHVNYKWTEV